MIVLIDKQVIMIMIMIMIEIRLPNCANNHPYPFNIFGKCY